MKVRAKRGHEGSIISRRRDGKPILFANSDPLSAEIEVGDIVEGEIVHEAKTYAIMRPDRIIKANGEVIESEES